MNYLHKNLLPYRIRKARKANKVNRNGQNYSKAKRLGLLFTMNKLDDYEAIRRFEKKLKGEGKQLSVLSFLPKQVENFDFHYDIFSGEDFSKTAKPVAENVNTFINENFDFLLCLDCDPNLYLKYILAASKAAYRIGCYGEQDDSQYFELMVRLAEGDGVEELINQIYHFTNKL